ncbi:hypothetical protein RHGRI_000996 [Rhododendron griersonianum]|uniref:ATP-dependent DNA ligase family profile domain-containing protein n=1 Tax=Rhododendron griersonianum TaxID=479676 RepID=A0AAV6LIL9_9ERIC|nr:hypothetical protein RHGRI_000996 [Rhododendron griersonianum]
MCDETKFSVVCSLFNWTQKAKFTAKKRSKLRKFLDAFCVRRGDYFGAVRLILPRPRPTPRLLRPQGVGARHLPRRRPRHVSPLGRCPPPLQLAEGRTRNRTQCREIRPRCRQRNFLDHPEYGHSRSDIIMQNVLVDRCILDGEMLVWDATMNRFAEFGSNQEIAKIAKEGFDTDRQLCCILSLIIVFFRIELLLWIFNALIYVAFDILYVGDTSVIHQSLKERQELLFKVVIPIKGRLKILVPSGGFNDHRPSGEPCWSVTAYNVDDVERFFKEAVENRDEGIVLKDRGSKWEPGDRSGKWLKLKPDFCIGGYYGSGHRGGEVAQFLVGLAERSSPNTFPSRFISFCRVATGL